jgi:CRP-like cAMP-binding protein
MDHSLIRANVAKHISLNETELAYFLSVLDFKTLKKKEYLLEEGQHCTAINYVYSGALRAFYRAPDGGESTMMFAVSDWWITDMPCFVSGNPAMVFIEAIEDSCVFQLTKEKYERLLATVPKFERYFRILMQNSYIREQLRVLQNLSSSAEERYGIFLKKYPHIANKVSQKNIASYLGITPEFLSVIRSNRRKSKIS